MSQNLTYLTTTSELASVANAIRTAGTTTASLTFPSGFVSAIGDLGGGADSQPSDNAVIFSDYVNVGGNAVTFMKPTKATIKGSADMFNRTDADVMLSIFAGEAAFTNKITTVIYDVNGTITRIPSYYANENKTFPYPPQSVLDNITFIGQNAFYNHGRYQTGSETLVLPNIQTIDLNAFNNNTILTSLTIGTYGNSNLQSIGQNAFRACSNLTTINILSRPTSNSSINSSAFRDVNSNCVMNVVWSEGEVSGFPGSYYPGTVNYDYNPNAQ